MIFDFSLDDDERALVEGARATLRGITGAGVPGLDGADDLAEHRSATWSALVEQGWPLLALPPSVDGVDLETSKLVLLLEESGRHLVSSPLVATLALAIPLLRAGDDETDVMPLLRRVAGGTPATAVWSQNASTVTPGAAADLAVDIEDDGLVLVVNRNGDGSSALSIIDAVSLTRRTRLAGFDELHPLYRIDIDACDLAPVASVTPDSHAVAHSTTLTLLAAELLGIAARSLELTVEHATTRTQFGQAIGSFQGVKHRLADAYVLLERARSLVYAAACTLDVDDQAPGDVHQLARLAKASASEAALQTAATGLQVHGALGLTRESEMSWLYRRARQASLLLGDHRAHYRIVGRSYHQEGASA